MRNMFNIYIIYNYYSIFLLLAVSRLILLDLQHINPYRYVCALSYDIRH